MALLISGPSGNYAEVDPTWKALRNSVRPLDHGGGGYYRIAVQSGALTTVSAGAPVFAFRWSNIYYNAIIWFFKWHWWTTTAFGAAQIVDHALYVGRSWTTNYGGGTAATLTGNNCKKRTIYGTTGVNYCSVSATAALTGSPTITLDSQPIMYRQGWSSALGDALIDPQPTDFETEQEHPIVLAASEGLVLQNVTLMGASGIIKLNVEVAWAEVPLANF